MKKSGFTLIELMISLAIIGILISIVSMSVETVNARARYSKIKADMDGIGQAAYIEHTNSSGSDSADLWPEMTSGTMPPSIAAQALLLSWPTPPCPGWYYSWEDWTLYPLSNSNSASVTLRRGNDTLLYNYCVTTNGGGNCYPADPLGFGGTPVDITVEPNHHIYCTE